MRGRRGLPSKAVSIFFSRQTRATTRWFPSTPKPVRPEFRLADRRANFLLPPATRKFPRQRRLKAETACFASPPVQTGVDGDAVKPGGKFRRAAKFANLLVGAEESLLREILGIGARAGHPKCQRMNHVLMIANQLFKSRQVAILTLQHQFCHRRRPCGFLLPGQTNAEAKSFELFFRRAPGGSGAHHTVGNGRRKVDHLLYDIHLTSRTGNGTQNIVNLSAQSHRLPQIKAAAGQK